MPCGGVRRTATILCLAFALTWGGPSLARAEQGPGSSPLWDPFEGFNRGIFDFNMWLSDHAIEPVANFWAAVIPVWQRRALGRLIYNARTPHRLANNLLQLKPTGAALETARFVVNSTLGVAGLFDAAGAWFRWHAPGSEDFGQTLGHYGMPPGPYLVIPIFGPSTVRDTTGNLVDIVFNPLTWYAGGGIVVGITTAVDTVDVINQFSLDPELLQDLDLFTLDSYIAVQDIYQQRRAAAVAE